MKGVAKITQAFLDKELDKRAIETLTRSHIALDVAFGAKHAARFLFKPRKNGRTYLTFEPGTSQEETIRATRI